MTRRLMALALIACVGLAGCTLYVPGGPTPPPIVAPDPEPTNQRPLALYSMSPGAAAVGESVTLDAFQSRDYDGQVVAHHWLIDGHGTQTASIVVVSWDHPGVYRIELIVTDNDGARSDATDGQITITSSEPPSCGGGGCG